MSEKNFDRESNLAPLGRQSELLLGNPPFFFDQKFGNLNGRPPGQAWYRWMRNQKGHHLTQKNVGSFVRGKSYARKAVFWATDSTLYGRPLFPPSIARVGQLTPILSSGPGTK